MAMKQGWRTLALLGIVGHELPSIPVAGYPIEVREPSVHRLSVANLAAVPQSHGERPEQAVVHQELIEAWQTIPPPSVIVHSPDPSAKVSTESDTTCVGTG